MLSVSQTSVATFSGRGPFNLGQRPKRSVEATGITFEVAAHGDTLQALRRLAERHHQDLCEVLATAIGEYLATDGNAPAESPGAILAAHVHAIETGAPYP